jgi:hypothetical protein
MQALIPVKPMASGPYSGKVQGLRLYLMLGFEITMSVTVEYRSAVTTDTIVQNVIVEFSLQSYIHVR